MSWWKHLNGKVKENQILKPCTAFKIGGPARLFVEPRDIDDLKLLLNYIKRYNISYLLLGGGSNILVSDSGTKKLVIRLSAPSFRKIECNGTDIEAGCGCSLSSLIRLSLERGLSGLEYLVGIPGTLGGAVMMNAGVRDIRPQAKAGWHAISDVVLRVTVMDRFGAIKVLPKNRIRFSYRQSDLDRYIVLGALLRLEPADAQALRRRAQRYLLHRRRTQGIGLPSAGCVFKNPAGHSAGKLIDSCGLKGLRVGGAAISARHANFIINTRHALAQDVLQLMAIMKRQVKKKFAIRLKPEIKWWD